MKEFTVVGNPIAHSKSPEIHAAFAGQFNITLNYEKLLAPVSEFKTFANQFFEHGNGANVTVPFKQDALAFADELSDAAFTAGAVNTLSKKHGKIIGDNTDGIGLVTDIRNNHKISFTDKEILIIGAGGAARGVIFPIAQENPTFIHIANRTHAKAMQLAKQFGKNTRIEAVKYEEITSAYDIIVNATSASLSGDAIPIPTIAINQYTFAYDMMYGSKPTDFMEFANLQGAKSADGLGMLVEQAAKSFEIWHQKTPETQSIIRAIRAKL